MLEPHRRRVDTVDDGIRILDELIEVIEGVYDGSPLAQLDDLQANASFALEESGDYEDALRTVVEELDAIITRRVDLDEPYFEDTLKLVVRHLSTLRDWLGDAQLQYDRERIHARKASGT